MRILVLGGTGAMGQPLIRLLEECGNEVYVTSRRNQVSKGNIHFFQGDAHDISFTQELLKNCYDTIVDFMIYSTEVFKERVDLYLNSTDQYVFLSSARVYADSKKAITEDSPRILDVCKNKEYLKTGEYALTKARSEDILFNSVNKNWTIIRPYITYNTKRLQLGGLELETWLFAALSGKPIVLPKDVGAHETTMTYGNDVAKAMVFLIGNPKALGEAFHITGTDHMKWRNVAEIYQDIIGESLGCRPELYMPETSMELSSIMGNAYQIKYDRLYDRVFDNTKFIRVGGGDFKFSRMEAGLRLCLKDYLLLPEIQILKSHNAAFEAWLDRNSGKGPSISSMIGTKNRMKYLGYYYAPQMMSRIKCIKEILTEKFSLSERK